MTRESVKFPKHDAIPEVVDDDTPEGKARAKTSEPTHGPEHGKELVTVDEPLHSDVEKFDFQSLDPEEDNDEDRPMYLLEPEPGRLPSAQREVARTSNHRRPSNIMPEESS